MHPRQQAIIDSIRDYSRQSLPTVRKSVAGREAFIIYSISAVYF